MKLGQAIKLCRQQKRLTQADLAARCSLSESYLSLIETGKRDPAYSTLEDISRGLQVPVSMLVFLAADAAELNVLGNDVKEKMSAALLSLLKASTHDSRSTNV
jgi:transcriptional regulator with XRE-family HTH domain